MDRAEKYRREVGISTGRIKRALEKAISDMSKEGLTLTEARIMVDELKHALDKVERQYQNTPLHAFMSEDFSEKESLLDGTCRNEIVSGRFTRHLMEKSGLLKYAGLTGKTRIVIEYNNDTGEGWRRIVTEDATTVATQTNR